MLGRAKQLNTTLTTWPSLLSAARCLREAKHPEPRVSGELHNPLDCHAGIRDSMPKPCRNVGTASETSCWILGGSRGGYKGHTLKRKNDAALASC